MDITHEEVQENKFDDSLERDKIPQDEGFKTCQATLVSPRMKRVLRMTAARNSILSGGTPFKEVGSSGKKFNMRKRLADSSTKKPLKSSESSKKSKLDISSTSSNETFIRHERDIFDRDSLEHVPTSQEKAMVARQEIEKRPTINESNKKPAIKENDKRSIKKGIAPRSAKNETDKRSMRRDISKKPLADSITFRKPNNFVPATNPRAIVSRNTSRSISQTRAIVPRAASQPRRVVKSNSFKSTAELERDYFNSLRSRF